MDAIDRGFKNFFQEINIYKLIFNDLQHYNELKWHGDVLCHYLKSHSCIKFRYFTVIP